MQKTDIEWTDYSWNPIKGICPVGCWYCYGRRMYQRFKWNPKMSFELNDPIAIDRLHYKNIPPGSKVFVCSTFELFHPKVPKSWRKIIFDVVKLNPKITFQILTKFPQNIDRLMPDNVWLGVTLDGIDPLEDVKKSWALRDVKAKIKFYSFEPLIGLPYLKSMYIFEWAIIGKLTGYGRKFNPKKRWIEEILDTYKECNIPIFLKNNLKEIWGEPLIQEFPEEGK